MTDIDSSLVNMHLLKNIADKIPNAEEYYMENIVKDRHLWKTDKDTINYFKKIESFFSDSSYILITNRTIEKVKEVSDKNLIESLKKEKKDTLKKIKELKKSANKLLSVSDLYKSNFIDCFNYGFVFRDIVELEENDSIQDKRYNSSIIDSIIKSTIVLLDKKYRELYTQEITYVSEEELKFKKLKEIQNKINEEKRTTDEIVEGYNSSLEKAIKDEMHYSKPGRFEPTNLGEKTMSIAKNGDYYDDVPKPFYGISESAQKSINERKENLQKAKDRQKVIEEKIKQVNIETSRELQKLYGEYYKLKHELENSSNYGRLMRKYGIIDLEQERHAREL